MAKRPMPRITEPDENLVHYVGDGFSGGVTLCGLTDFITANAPGEATEEPVSCQGCIAIRKHCESFAPHKD